MAQKIIVDTDPEVDDAMAIQFALNSPELEILGLTTVFGNVDIELTTENALRIVKLADRADIPVAKGAKDPLEGKFGGGAPFVHGDDGQGNTFKPSSGLTPVDLHAVDFIIEQVLTYPNEIILAALGPLTNLALALQKEPAIIPLVKGIVMMGGNAFCPGNARPTAEANILSDPEAADIVFATDWPMTMIGLDVTHQVVLPSATYQSLTATTGSALHKHVMEAYVFYEAFVKQRNKEEGSYVHDSSVIAYLINDELFKAEQYPIKVELSNSISRGKTWPLVEDDDGRDALKPWRNRPKVNICLDVQSEAFIHLLTSRLY